uniref:Uncharacterized protein n=1 Tax=Cacopsylla melanoneura TaxID=428564 RepID=A0A8D9C2U6_9HEMI
MLLNCSFSLSPVSLLLPLSSSISPSFSLFDRSALFRENSGGDVGRGWEKFAQRSVPYLCHVLGTPWTIACGQSASRHTSCHYCSPLPALEITKAIPSTSLSLLVSFLSHTPHFMLPSLSA